ncbi:MAG: hypothetical protein ACREQA_21740 [Candidatus Binatia bacterium]
MRVLKAAWACWKIVGRKIGDFQARMLLSVFYFVILGPFALVLRWRSDPLAIKPGTSRGWRSKSDGDYSTGKRAGSQF